MTLRFPAEALLCSVIQKTLSSPSVLITVNRENGYKTWQSSSLYAYVGYFKGLNLHEAWQNKNVGYAC